MMVKFEHSVLVSLAELRLDKIMTFLINLIRSMKSVVISKKFQIQLESK